MNNSTVCLMVLLISPSSGSGCIDQDVPSICKWPERCSYYFLEFNKIQWNFSEQQKNSNEILLNFIKFPDVIWTTLGMGHIFISFNKLRETLWTLL